MRISKVLVFLMLILCFPAEAEQTWFTPDSGRLSVPYFGSVEEREKLRRSLESLLPEVTVLSDKNSHQIILRGDERSISRVRKFLSLFSSFYDSFKL